MAELVPVLAVSTVPPLDPTIMLKFALRNDGPPAASTVFLIVPPFRFIVAPAPAVAVRLTMLGILSLAPLRMVTDPPPIPRAEPVNDTVPSSIVRALAVWAALRLTV